MKGKRILLLAVTTLFWFAQYVYTPYQTPYLSAIGIPASVIGVILGAYGFSQMIIRIPVGVAADRKGKHKWFVAMGALLAGTASLLRAFFPMPAVFLVANIISGTASSMWISYTVLYTSYYKQEEMQSAVGMIAAFNNAGIVIGFAAGSLVVGKLGVPSLFWMSFVAGIAGFIAALFIKENDGIEKPPTIKELLSSLKNKRLIIFSVAAAMLQAVHLSTALAFTSDIAKSLSTKEWQIGVCSMVYMLFCVLSSYFPGTKLGQRIGAKILMPVFFGFMVIYCVFVPFAPSMWVLLILQMIGGTGNAALFSLIMTGALKNVELRKRSTAMGFFQAVYSIGMTVGPAVAGAVADSLSMTAAYFAMAGFAVIGIAIVIFANRKIA